MYLVDGFGESIQTQGVTVGLSRKGVVFSCFIMLYNSTLIDVTLIIS